jgi:SAM-dependent methyltransferase
MDDVAKYNCARWSALVKAQAIFTLPRLDLTPADAQVLLDPDHRLGDLRGKQVLCLAGGGGQQSVAFALLGALVTVVDLSPEQLQQDITAAAHYHLTVRAIQGDMRDLSPFGRAAFDVVYQPYSINFVPDARVVFREVAHVLRLHGTYHFMCANPFVSGLTTHDWNGAGYTLKHPYLDGAELVFPDEAWVFRGKQPDEPIAGPKEYRHSLSTIVNGLVAQGFVLERLDEVYFGEPDIAAEPGTNEHLSAVAPPWVNLWARYHPNGAGH